MNHCFTHCFMAGAFAATCAIYAGFMFAKAMQAAGPGKQKGQK